MPISDFTKPPSGDYDDHNSTPKTIGPYKLLQKIGEGGMGTVWMAEQEKPVRRRVALKLIKAAIADKQIIARFEAERQALAMMDHQNISKVLDAGTTETGTPYFVMELMHGIPINEYCDRNKLTPDQRLKLFVPVCKAIQHAHQKGIIHRDLKPSNVLVQMSDGEPVAKVIDFGLAKALQHQTKLTDKTMFTEFGQVVGTLQYMSPEQATMDAMSVDTRSDIYSLGVMLYELLAGSTPVEKETLNNNALLQVLAAIREKEPPKPSHRLSSSVDKLTAISELRQIQPAKLQQILRGELDWIVMKALDKDRTRRYETANAFAEDINNYLTGDTVNARPPSTIYQLQKFARKNKGLAASMAVIGAILLAAVAFSSMFAVRANIARSDAVEQKKLADIKTAVAQASEQKAVAAQNEALAAKKKALEEKARADEEAEKARDFDASGKFLLANVRWNANRVAEARELLEQVPEENREFEWYYSRRHFLGSDFTCYGHTDLVTSVAFSPDGRRIASASWDDTIKLWDAASGKQLQTLSGHKSYVTSVAFSPDGRRIASASLDDTIMLWDAASGNAPQTLVGHKGGVNSVAFSPDGRWIASASNDNTVMLWNATSGSALQTLKGHTAQVTSVAFSPDGGLIASGSNDDTIKLWGRTNFDNEGVGIDIEDIDLDRGRTLFTLIEQEDELPRRLHRDHDGIVTSVVFSPDGLRLASASGDNTIKLWDVASGSELQTLNGHNSSVHSVAFSPDGLRLASASWDHTVKLWDAVNGSVLQTLTGHPSDVKSVAFSPDGRRIASAGGTSVKLWDVASGSALQTLTGHTDRVASVTFSPNGRQIVSASRDKTIKLWDAASGIELKTLTHSNGVTSVTFSPDGRQIASTSGGRREARMIKLWDAASGGELLTLKGHTSVAFSPDGLRIATASNDNAIKLRDAISGSELLTLKGHTNEVKNIAFSPDGRWIASASRDRMVKLWNVVSGSEINTLSGHTSDVKSVAFSPDGRRIASVSGGTFKLWDAVSGSELHTLIGHSMAFSPDGRRIASASGSSVKLWDAVSGSELHALTGHTDRVGSVAFSPDGRRIASASWDNTIKLWDAFSGSELQTLTGHIKRVYSVAFSPDDSKLYSKSKKEKIVWDTKNGTVLKNVSWQEVPSNKQRKVSTDGRWLLTSEGKNVLLVDLEFKNTPQEKAYRAAKARFNPWWHREQALKATEDKNWYAATVHYSWLIKNAPDQAEYYDSLHDVHQKLEKQFKASKSGLASHLSSVVKESLKLPRGKTLSKK